MIPVGFLQLFVKVFVQNGECKTILVDEKMSVSEVLVLLYEKCEVKPNVRWTLVEQIPDLFIGEFILELGQNLKGALHAPRVVLVLRNVLFERCGKFTPS